MSKEETRLRITATGGNRGNIGEFVISIHKDGSWVVWGAGDALYTDPATHLVSIPIGEIMQAMVLEANPELSKQEECPKCDKDKRLGYDLSPRDIHDRD